MRNTRSRSALCLPRHRGVIGIVNANHASSGQAIATIAMYAQLALSVLSGAWSARTPLLSCARRFS